MTDITDQDRSDARQWAEAIGRSDAPVPDHLWHSASRVILATVDAPTPTLADELREHIAHGEDLAVWNRAAVEKVADRVEQIEQERDDLSRARESQEKALHEHGRLLSEARAEVERLTAENENLRKTDNYREFRERFLTVQKGAESTAESLPDPADVKTGEVWCANIWYDDEQHPGIAIKSAGGDWNVCRVDGTRSTYRMNEYLTLVCPLVPLTDLIDQAATTTAETITKALGITAHRTITRVEELDALPEMTVITHHGDAMQKRDGNWYVGSVTGGRFSYPLPATVLYEPVEQ